MLHGLRPGRAVLRVRGIRSSADTAPSSRRPGRELEREVIVTPRVVSVRFFTKPDTVRAGAPFTLDVRAFDADGGEVADVPIELRFKNGGIDHVGLVGRRTPHQLYSPGVTRLVARVKQLADTATIVAVDSAASRR